jgi:DNA-directed RNA polymerase subunit RPC12/RpoP
MNREEGAKEPPTPPVYKCANCCKESAIMKEARLICPYCIHATAGSSTVFFKQRTKETTYDTI